MNLKNNQVCLVGGDELASAVAIKLFRCGIRVLMFADMKTNYLRYHLSFGDALHVGKRTIAGVSAVPLPEEKLAILNGQAYAEKIARVATYIQDDRQIPIIDQSEYQQYMEAEPARIVVNTVNSTGKMPPVNIDDTRLVIGIYPFHIPGKDCHIAVESRLNYQLGALYSPTTTAEARQHDALFFNKPLLYCPSPIGGVWISTKSLGDTIAVNEAIGKINEIEIRSPYAGQVWGIVHSGRFVSARNDVAVILEGNPHEQFRSLGFREMAIAGGILEAVLHHSNFA